MSYDDDYSDLGSVNTTTSNLLPVATYEVKIEKVEIKEFDNKTTGVKDHYINFTFRVRDDVEQAYKNKCVFESLFKSKADGKFNLKRLTQILEACYPQNAPKKNSGLNELLKRYVGKPLAIRVGIRPNFKDPNVEENNIIAFLPTKFGAVTITPPVATVNAFAGQVVSSQGVIEDDDELPF